MCVLSPLGTGRSGAADLSWATWASDSAGGSRRTAGAVAEYGGAHALPAQPRVCTGCSGCTQYAVRVSVTVSQVRGIVHVKKLAQCAVIGSTEASFRKRDAAADCQRQDAEQRSVERVRLATPVR